MKTVALVAPFFQENTLRYVQALAELENCRPTLLTQDAPEKLPAALRPHIAAVQRVVNCMNGQDLARGCQAIAKSVGPLDGIFGVLEQLQIPLAEARDACHIPGMGLEVTQNFRDKATMKDALNRHGVPVARHARVEADADAIEFADRIGYPIILKPVDGLGSKSTYRIKNGSDLQKALRALKPCIEAPAQAEEFVVGSEQTFETVTIAGKPVWWSGTYYMNRPLEVLENAWMQYCVVLPREENLPEFLAFQDTNARALKALGMGTGLSHMEWFRRQDGSHVVSEVGARPPGVHIMPMMGLVNGIDMIRTWTRLMVHETWPEGLKRNSAAGVAFFRGSGRGGRVASVTGLGEAQEAAGKWVVDRKLPHVGQPRSAHYEGEGWAIVHAPETKTVVDALRELVTRVKVTYG